MRIASVRCNSPYLAFAALIAAGLSVIDEKLVLPDPFVGDAYRDSELPEIPKTLREAIEIGSDSIWLREALGNEVVDHYLHTARWEQSQYDRRVMDWELARGIRGGNRCLAVCTSGWLIQ